MFHCVFKKKKKKKKKKKSFIHIKTHRGLSAELRVLCTIL